ncbi:hypothetical protein AYI69_g11044 [Smittium culicis]|uniref:Pentatricopeptide repeat-containing protein n=1 Tax=Smittium culicis TaxID=133412 RepID=A0A1R1X1I2_9FUNG|nr:hypothetical protein AYI69_g11044 [Smittium culicis]
MATTNSSRASLIKTRSHLISSKHNYNHQRFNLHYASNNLLTPILPRNTSLRASCHFFNGVLPSNKYQFSTFSKNYDQFEFQEIDLEQLINSVYLKQNIFPLHFIKKLDDNGYFQLSNYLSSDPSESVIKNNVLSPTTLNLILSALSNLDLDNPSLLYSSSNFIYNPSFLKFLSKNIQNNRSVDFQSIFEILNQNSESYVNKKLLGAFFVLNYVISVTEILKVTTPILPIDTTLNLITFYSKIDYFIQILLSKSTGDLSAVDTSYIYESVNPNIFLHSIPITNNDSQNQDFPNKRFSKEKGTLRRLTRHQHRSNKVFEKNSYGVFLPTSKAAEMVQFLSKNNHDSSHNSMHDIWLHYLTENDIIKPIDHKKPLYLDSQNSSNGTDNSTELFPSKLAIDMLNSLSDFSASKEATKILVRSFSDASKLDSLSTTQRSYLISAITNLIKSLAIKGNPDSIELIVSLFSSLLSSSDSTYTPSDTPASLNTKVNYKDTPNEILVARMTPLISSMYIMALRISSQYNKELWAYRLFLDRWRSLLDKFRSVEPSPNFSSSQFLRSRWAEGSISNQHIYSLLSQGQLDAAYKTLRAASRAAKIGHSAPVYDALIRCFFGMGDFEKAMELFYAMETPSNPISISSDTSITNNDISTNNLELSSDTSLTPRATKDTYSLVFQCLILSINSICSSQTSILPPGRDQSLDSLKITLYNHVYRAWKLCDKRWEIQIPVPTALSVLNSTLNDSEILNCPENDSIIFSYFDLINSIIDFFGNSISISVETIMTTNPYFISKSFLLAQTESSTTKFEKSSERFGNYTNGSSIESIVIKSILLVLSLSKFTTNSNFSKRKNKEKSTNNMNIDSTIIASKYINKELDNLGIECQFDPASYSLQLKRRDTNPIFGNGGLENTSKFMDLKGYSILTKSQFFYWNETSLYRSKNIIESCRSDNIIHAMKHFNQAVSDNLVVSSEAFRQLFALVDKLKKDKSKSRGDKLTYLSKNVDLDVIYDEYIPAMQKSLLPVLSKEPGKNYWKISSDQGSSINDPETGFSMDYFVSTESLVIENLVKRVTEMDNFRKSKLLDGHLVKGNNGANDIQTGSYRYIDDKLANIPSNSLGTESGKYDVKSGGSSGLAGAIRPTFVGKGKGNRQGKYGGKATTFSGPFNAYLEHLVSERLVVKEMRCSSSDMKRGEFLRVLEMMDASKLSANLVTFELLFEYIAIGGQSAAGEIWEFVCGKFGLDENFSEAGNKEQVLGLILDLVNPSSNWGDLSADTLRSRDILNSLGDGLVRSSGDRAGTGGVGGRSGHLVGQVFSSAETIGFANIGVLEILANFYIDFYHGKNQTKKKAVRGHGVGGSRSKSIPTIKNPGTLLEVGVYSGGVEIEVLAKLAKVIRIMAESYKGALAIPCSGRDSSDEMRVVEVVAENESRKLLSERKELWEKTLIRVDKELKNRPVF